MGSGGIGDDGVPLSTTERFDPKELCWQALPPMPTARRNCAAASSNGMLYVVGGKDEGWRVVAAVECFDVAAGLWRTLPNMPTARSDCSAAVLAGAVYVAGGLTDWTLHDVVERFDADRGYWDSIEPLSIARRKF